MNEVSTTPVVDSAKPDLRVLNGRGGAIRECRDAMGLTRAQFANGAGISQWMLRSVELGEREWDKPLLQRLTYFVADWAAGKALAREDRAS